ncbi:hypothetical protein HETIRDRAFT_449240 [Heterobasidion irregulare TC 32-1]|uniref:Uncharacterized protein n=1 Tax=Heterobasidion irregulare (strain TC 32-1) TaxID=747525 RepID=W4KCR1_HETIT|nr:uncharacterized protein HETIRDRAFT_449240 [Heterobasidion irregulare TC 32-1]ETW83529.1 hypothetical protein HETIRDRAFT_449240 [Heterobasidion irregulare TC 32-1]
MRCGHAPFYRAHSPDYSLPGLCGRKSVHPSIAHPATCPYASITTLGAVHGLSLQSFQARISILCKPWPAARERWQQAPEHGPSRARDLVHARGPACQREISLGSGSVQLEGAWGGAAYARAEWLQDYAQPHESYLPTAVPPLSSLLKPALKANLGLEAKVDAERATDIDAKARRRNLSQTLGQTSVRSSLFLFHSLLLLPSSLPFFFAVPALLTGITATELRDTGTDNDEVADGSGADGGPDDTMFDA